MFLNTKRPILQLLVAVVLLSATCFGQGVWLVNPFLESSAPPANGLLTGLQAYWKFDEASGNAEDAHTSNRDLTQMGTVGATTGVLNGARTVESGEAFSVASGAWNSIGGAGFTVTAWVRLSNTNAQMIVNKGQSGVDGGTTSKLAYRLDFSPSLGFVWNVFDVTGTSLAHAKSPPGFQTNVWYFLSGRYDPATTNVFLTYGTGSTLTQDSAGALNTGPANDPVSTQYFAVGALVAEDGTSIFNSLQTAEVDEAGLWKRKLSDADEVLLFNGGTPLAYGDFD